MLAFRSDGVRGGRRGKAIQREGGSALHEVKMDTTAPQNDVHLPLLRH